MSNEKFNKKNNKQALKSLMNIGTDKLKELIKRFMNGDELRLNDDEGLILSLFINYYRPESNIDDSINSFIGLIFYKGLRDKV